MLSIAVAFNFMEQLGNRPDPNKVWIVSLITTIRPCDELDLKDLSTSDYDLDVLMRRSMMGHLLFCGIEDVTKLKGAVDQETIAQWHAFRTSLNGHGHTNVPLFLYQLGYNKNRSICVGPLPIFPDAMERARILFGAYQRHPDWWKSGNPMLKYDFLHASLFGVALIIFRHQHTQYAYRRRRLKFS